MPRVIDSTGSIKYTAATITSGQLGSGSVTGQAGGGAFVIASGSIGTFDLSSGVVQSGYIGNNAVVSGSIGSGQIAAVHIQSGTLLQGSNVTITYGLSGITIATAGGASLSSGQVGSGFVASGAVQGYFGVTRHIASGTVGVYDLGSGAIIAGTVGSGAVQSGNIASGQIGTYQLSSGTQTTATNFVLPGTLPTQELISGVRAVNISQSGNLQIAMASLSGRYPAMGIVIDNVLSGQQANIYTVGKFQFTSGMNDYSGYLGTMIYVGRSGHLVTVSGSWNSGGFAAGDVIQKIGYPYNSGGILVC